MFFSMCVCVCLVAVEVITLLILGVCVSRLSFTSPSYPTPTRPAPRRHAQLAISRICCKHTVIIGHALNNDLQALKVSEQVCSRVPSHRGVGREPGNLSIRTSRQAPIEQ